MVELGFNELSKLLSNQVLDYSKPGFIITRFGVNVSKRDLMACEDFLCLLEQNVIEREGEEGKKFLYLVGKTFGYNFGIISFFPNIKNKNFSRDEATSIFLDFLKMIRNIWGEELIVDKMDLDSKKIKYLFKNFIVFRKNGFGYSIVDGSGTGIFDFFVDDDRCEGVRTVLNKNEFVVNISHTNFYLPVEKYDFDQKENLILNEVTMINKRSLKDFIDSGILEYKKNSFFIGNYCFFQCEISFFYILEFEFNKKAWNDLLFDSAFAFSKNFFDDVLNKFPMIDEKSAFASNFLSALGLGDVNFFTDKVVCKFLPFHPLARKIDFMFFKGIFSGALSSINGKNIFLRKHKYFITDNLTVEFQVD